MCVRACACVCVRGLVIAGLVLYDPIGRGQHGVVGRPVGGKKVERMKAMVVGHNERNTRNKSQPMISSMVNPKPRGAGLDPS